MELSQIIPHIEALIFASDKPLSTLELVDLLNNALGFIEDKATLDQVESAIEAIREKYDSEFYAFEMNAQKYIFFLVLTAKKSTFMMFSC